MGSLMNGKRPLSTLAADRLSSVAKVLWMLLGDSAIPILWLKLKLPYVPKCWSQIAFLLSSFGHRMPDCRILN